MFESGEESKLRALSSQSSNNQNSDATIKLILFSMELFSQSIQLLVEIAIGGSEPVVGDKQEFKCRIMLILALFGIVGLSGF